MGYRVSYWTAVLLGVGFLGTANSVEAGVKGKTFQTLMVGLTLPRVVNIAFDNQRHYTITPAGGTQSPVGDYTEYGADYLTVFEGGRVSYEFPVHPVELFSGTCLVSTFYVGTYLALEGGGPSYLMIGYAP